MVSHVACAGSDVLDHDRWLARCLLLFEKPPFTPTTADFRSVTCDRPEYTQLRTLTPASPPSALWWKPTYKSHSAVIVNGSCWPAGLSDHRRLPGIGTQRRLFDGELVGISECSVPVAVIRALGKRSFNVGVDQRAMPLRVSIERPVIRAGHDCRSSRIQLSHTGVELVHELLLLEQIFSVSLSSSRYVVGKGSEVYVYPVGVHTGPGWIGNQRSYFIHDANGGAGIILKNSPSEASPKSRAGLAIDPHPRSYASVSHRIPKGVYQNSYRVLAIGGLGQVVLTPVPDVGPAKSRRASSK